MSPHLPLTLVIPTYRREDVLLDTLDRLLAIEKRASEILVVDQTEDHQHSTEERLGRLAGTGAIRWLRLDKPSIPCAMNTGLEEARQETVLFLDDDVVPLGDLLGAHLRAHEATDASLVAGRVLQPWDPPTGTPDSPLSRFSGAEPQWNRDFMGGNFSMRRSLAVRLGGFDENFVGAAYNYEKEFAGRLLEAGRRIRFEPKAAIRHLQASTGGTRSHGLSYATIKPHHAVGEYYYLLRGRLVDRRVRNLMTRPVRAISTRHHLHNPWWIPLTLATELLAFSWALSLAARGPRLGFVTEG